MPRAPFNTTVEFFAGPGQANAGESRGTANARLVLKDGITLVGTGAPDVHGWITCDTLTPVGSWTPDCMGFRPSLGDTVAIPVNSEPQYWVCWVEEILWGEQVLYHRAIIAPLPRPEECDDDGDPVGGGEDEMIGVSGGAVVFLPL